MYRCYAKNHKRMWCRELLLLVMVATGTLVTTTTAKEEDDPTLQHQLHNEHLPMFQYHPAVRTIGPNIFPRPTDINRTLIHPTEFALQPAHGTHRPEQDAVVAYAAEYPLSNYVVFIESLRETGFEGDIVLAVSPLDKNKQDVWEYLTEPGNHIVLYTPVLTCYNAEGETVDSAKGGSRVCQTDGVWKSKADGNPVADPRPSRTVQTLRYEIYWRMVLDYQPHSWILLVDVRDTVFQTNPFAPLPRASEATSSGRLYFFGENIEATRLGKSKQNRKWLQVSYGNRVADLLADKPTVCSGATLGEQVALEMYIRAMVAESDDTGVKLVGADQGFHNYLHYSHKLTNADAIRSIVVFDQGHGIVNNMGAMRTQPLPEWGNKQILHMEINEQESNPRKRNRYTVRNWDGTPSPIVHQYDRHKELSDFFFKVHGSELMEGWKKRRQHIHIAATS